MINVLDAYMDSLSAIVKKNNLICSEKVEFKAAKLLQEQRIKLEVPTTSRRHWFHVCPFFDDKTVSGFVVAYHQLKDLWTCTCTGYLMQSEETEVCSHVLAAMYLKEEMK